MYKIINSIFGLIIFGLLFTTSCQEQDQSENKEKETEVQRPLIEEENGRYTEWYPGHKQVKKTGRKNKKGEKTGVWKMFSEQGYELSIHVYRDGKLHGDVIVYHPNGSLNYNGEYYEGERVGLWKFYDEKGNLIKEEDFGEYPID